jgi:hypothetical protein
MVISHSYGSLPDAIDHYQGCWMLNLWCCVSGANLNAGVSLIEDASNIGDHVLHDFCD